MMKKYISIITSFSFSSLRLSYLGYLAVVSLGINGLFMGNNLHFMADINPLTGPLCSRSLSLLLTSPLSFQLTIIGWVFTLTDCDFWWFRIDLYVSMYTDREMELFTCLSGQLNWELLQIYSLENLSYLFW